METDVYQTHERRSEADWPHAAAIFRAQASSAYKERIVDSGLAVDSSQCATVEDGILLAVVGFTRWVGGGGTVESI